MKRIALALLCAALATPAIAQKKSTPEPRPVVAEGVLPKAPPGKVTFAQALANPLVILQQFSVADLQAALADAQAKNDTTTIPCWTNLLAAAQEQQTTPSLPVGVFSAIQQARDLKNLAASVTAPNGPLAQLNIACAPLLMDINNTLLVLGISTGIVVGTGGLSLPALPGLLPLLLTPKPIP